MSLHPEVRSGACHFTATDKTAAHRRTQQESPITWFATKERSIKQRPSTALGHTLDIWPCTLWSANYAYQTMAPVFRAGSQNRRLLQPVQSTTSHGVLAPPRPAVLRSLSHKTWDNFSTAVNIQWSDRAHTSPGSHLVKVLGVPATVCYLPALKPPCR